MSEGNRETAVHQPHRAPHLPRWDGTATGLRRSHARLTALLAIERIEVLLGFLTSHLQEAERVNDAAVRGALSQLGGQLAGAYPLDGPVSTKPLADALREVAA